MMPGSQSLLLAQLPRQRKDPLKQLAPMLQSIKAPTLLVWGEKDAIIPFSNARDYLRQLPNAKLVSFPGLGHVPQEETPALSLAPVQAFLEQ